jgi:hypothetical protein
MRNEQTNAHKRTYTEFSEDPVDLPNDIMRKLIVGIGKKPVEKIYLVSIDGSDNLTSEEFLKVKRQQQVFTILSSTTTFLEKTLFVVVICYSNETKVYMFYENFSVEQKFQITFEPKRTFFNNNLEHFKWASVFQKTFNIINNLKSLIVSPEFQGIQGNTPASSALSSHSTHSTHSTLNKKVTLLVYMFLCGGNNQLHCKDFKQTVFGHSGKYRWYPQQSTTDNYNQADFIGSSASWVFVLPDMISFDGTILSTFNKQKQLVKSLNTEFNYDGIVSIEYPTDEFTLHTLLNETPTISSSSKGMNTAINNKLLRLKEIFGHRNKVDKRVRNHRYLLEINKTHNGSIIYKALKTTCGNGEKGNLDDLLDSMILSIPDIHQTLIQLQKLLSVFFNKSHESPLGLLNFIVAKNNMISVLIDNHKCWNQFITNPDKTLKCFLYSLYSLSSLSKLATLTTYFQGNQLQQFNLAVFESLSTVFTGQPNYENERFIISKILMLVNYQCKTCNKKIGDYQSFFSHFYCCLSEIQPKNNWELSSCDEKTKLFCELKQKLPNCSNFLNEIYSNLLPTIK